MKKKLLFISLLTLMTLSLFACGGKKDILTKFEDALKSKNIAYEKVEMAAALVGAEKGTKFLIGEGRVELYVFDKGSEKYKEFEKSQTMYVEGIASFPAIVTDGVAMLVTDLDTATYEAILRSVLD